MQKGKQALNASGMGIQIKAKAFAGKGRWVRWRMKQMKTLGEDIRVRKERKGFKRRNDAESVRICSESKMKKELKERKCGGIPMQ